MNRCQRPRCVLATIVSGLLTSALFAGQVSADAPPSPEEARQGAEKLTMRGYAEFQKGNTARALEYLDEAIRVAPDHDRAYLARAVVWRSQQEWNRAIQDLDEYIRFSPTDADAAVGFDFRGSIWEELGDLDMALADYDQAIRLDPTMAQPHLGRADIAMERQKPQEALPEYGEAIRLAPEFLDAYLHRSDCLVALGDYEQAIADLTDAIRLDSSATIAYAKRASAWSLLGGAEQAQADSITAANMYLWRATQLVPQVEEHLVNERDLLEGEVWRLRFELLTPDELPSVDPAQMTVDDWLIFADAYARAGHVQERRDALQSALTGAKLLDSSMGFGKQELLQRIATEFARLGDSEAASESAMAIQHDGKDAVHVTARGVMKVPADAGQSFTLLTVTAILLTLDDPASSQEFSPALDVAGRIPSATYQAVAYWMIAMRQAEQGDLASALATLQQANELERRPSASEWNAIIEFTTSGPKQAPVELYRALALGCIAQQQALHGDDEAARTTLDRIDQELRDLSIVELAHVLGEQNRPELASEWMERIQNSDLRNTARYDLAGQQLRLGNDAAAEGFAAAVTSPYWEARTRMNFADHYLTTETTDEAGEQIELARQAAGRIISARAVILHQLGLLQDRAGDRGAAIETLQMAAKEARGHADLDVRIRMLSQFAGALTRMGARQEARETIEAAIALTRESDDFARPMQLQAIAEELAGVGDLETADEVAHSIQDGSERSQSLGAVAVGYAELGDVRSSRLRFAEGFEAALTATDLLGLETPYSKGGAIRHLAREQARLDVFGLEKFLRGSESPNIQAYGYLGLAETLVPEAAERVLARGYEFPDGLLGRLLEERFFGILLSQGFAGSADASYDHR